MGFVWRCGGWLRERNNDIKINRKINREFDVVQVSNKFVRIEKIGVFSYIKLKI